MFSRRSFVAGAAGAVFTTLLGSRPARARSADYDIVIVGAGTAGLAAGKAISQSNRTFLILEARNRVGGRAHTDFSGLNHPFDCGAHWLHCAHENRLAELAKRQGYRLASSSRESTMLVHAGQFASSTEHRVFQRAIGRLEDVGSQWLKSGRDTSIANLASGDQELARALVVAAIEMAEEPDRLSLEDYASLGKGRDLTVKGGLGAFVATLARGLPIQLNASVQAVSWGGSGVELSGGFGKIVAKKCIITVPTGVLAGGDVHFNPQLPPSVVQALNDLPLGVMNKVGIRLSEPIDIDVEYVLDVDDLNTGRWQVMHLAENNRIATLLTVGDHARGLSAEGSRAMEDFAAERLRSLFGSKVRIDRTVSTAWDRDPYAKGAYSYARVGSAEARSIYTEPVAEKLFFAGEASPGSQAVTVGGAYSSGMVAARAALDAIGNER